MKLCYAFGSSQHFCLMKKGRWRKTNKQVKKEASVKKYAKNKSGKNKDSSLLMR